MRRSIAVVVWFCIACFFMAPCTFSFSQEAGSALSMRITRHENREILFRCDMVPRGVFYLDYTHSSDKTPVHDVFRVDPDGGMVLVEEAFSWYGAGLEFDSEYSGAKAIYEGRETRILLNRKIPTLLLRVGRVAGHRITCGEVVVPLQRLAKGGELLEIWVVREGAGSLDGGRAPRSIQGESGR